MPDRYRRQKAFVEVGDVGQERLAQSRVAIIGMGALGAMVAERLCRMGIGYLRLIDRDWVELDNLPRQTLYTTKDAEEIRPKAIAAKSHLLEINPDIQIDTQVRDVHCNNIAESLEDIDCIVDGSDNFETRFLVNDFAWKNRTPWVHGGVVGASGQTMSYVPGKTSCFRCLLPELPSIEHMQTCDATGVLGAAVGVIASWQALDTTKLLLGKDVAWDGCLRVFDLWQGEVRKIRVPQCPNCPVCVRSQYDFLNGEFGSKARVLCGRGAVQIQPPNACQINLASLASRLQTEGEVIATAHILRFHVPPFSITVFSDGRAIIHGTENPDEARKIYSRWIGG